MCARTAGVAEAKRLPNAPDPPAEGGAFRVGPPHRCEGKLPQLRVHEDYARRGARGPSASRSASCGAPSDGPCGLLGVCGLVCKPQGRSTTTGLKYRPVPSHTAPAAGAGLPAPCATLAATSTPSCVSDPCPQQPVRVPFPLQWGTTDQRGGPNASTDADQLVARRSSDSAMDGGREERPEAAEASPNHAVHHAQAARLCQPLGQLVESADRSSVGKWPGESVRGAGPARSQ